MPPIPRERMQPLPETIPKQPLDGAQAFCRRRTVALRRGRLDKTVKSRFVSMGTQLRFCRIAMDLDGECHAGGETTVATIGSRQELEYL